MPPRLPELVVPDGVQSVRIRFPGDRTFTLRVSGDAVTFGLENAAGAGVTRFESGGSERSVVVHLRIQAD